MSRQEQAVAFASVLDVGEAFAETYHVPSDCTVGAESTVTDVA